MEEGNSASANAKEVTRLWRAWRTVHEMVQDRVRGCVTQDGLGHRKKGKRISMLT